MTDPRLYILMRTDMDSMNAGKAMAQAAHAANAFVADIEKRQRERPQVLEVDRAYMKWKAQAHQNFGTTIVLGVDSSQLHECVAQAGLYGFVANIVHDPTYPIRDGSVTHLIPVDTCGYVFGPEGEVACLKGLSLHP